MVLPAQEVSALKEGTADVVSRCRQEAATAMQEAEARHAAEVERLAAAAQKASAELLAEQQCVAALKVRPPPPPGGVDPDLVTLHVLLH